METQALYDLSPIVRVMLTGLLIASVPLLWVWWRNQNTSTARRLQALTVLTLFLTFDLVLFGAFTRLTDSGLGCPDWPGCYGNASPLGAVAEITQAQAAMPTGPVTHGKAWVEMVHRYLATSVGVLILVLAVASWWARRKDASINPWWPTFTLVWVCVQGAFGALTVTMKLFPAIVTLHLVGGLVLLALLCAQAVGFTRSRAVPVARVGLGLACVLLAAQIVLGGWVSTNYAVLACNTFPLCQGSWWPVMDFQHAFEIWRPLGRMQDGSYLSFAGLTAIHYAHRLMAYLVLWVLALVAWRLHRSPATRRQARWLAALTLLQFATGLSNVVLGWPLLAAVAHTGGAAALVVVLTWTVCAQRTARAAAPAVSPTRSRLSA
ncbi:heme A synthase [Rhodoferax sp. WC2427]|uniref:COX15/CtaA family protein n=1 Tax=Rhodoferax sp. WC2427 TaxID=3234144 RepID=UPI003467CD99